MKHNLVETYDNRFSSFFGDREFTFITIMNSAGYVQNSKYDKTRWVSTNGKNYTYEHWEILYGTYYFVSDKKIEH